MPTFLQRHVLTLLALAGAAGAQDLAGDWTLHRLLIDGEEWQVVAEGIGFADGACTDAEGNFYFSDLRGNAIYKVTAAGEKTKLLDEAASGLKFAPDGRLYACHGGRKRVFAIDLANKAVEVLAENVEPNDLVVTHRGHVYFTETAKKQVVFLDPKTKQPRVVDTGINGPNGITLSPDQGTLAVSDYKGASVWMFRIEADGSLGAKTPSMTMQAQIDLQGEFKFNAPPPYRRESGGDGMTTDSVGRYFVATTLGVQVFDATGRMCGVLPRPGAQSPTSCVLSGPERCYLFITSRDRIFRRKVQATGNVFYQPPAK
jgi:enterochelin esterase family protein